MATYLIRFTVEGKGYFPVDMLRYDSCFPSNQSSVTRLGNSPESREVYLARVTNRKQWTPTYDRWRSFGWIVTHTDTPFRMGD